MKIVLPLPDTLTSQFIVTLTGDEAVPWRLGGPHRRLALTTLGTPRLRLTRHRGQWKPIGVTLTRDERRLLRRSDQHLAVSTTTPLHDQPAAVQAARAVARALATAHGTLLADPLTGATLPAREPEPGAFRLQDGWLGWDIGFHDETRPSRTTAGTRDGLTITSRGLRRFALPDITITSRGLRRFALPEITITLRRPYRSAPPGSTTCTHALCATQLLRTVAARLVADHLAFAAANPDARRRAIDDHLPLPPGPHGVRLLPCTPADGSIQRLEVAPTDGTSPIPCLETNPPSDRTDPLTTPTPHAA